MIDDVGKTNIDRKRNIVHIQLITMQMECSAIWPEAIGPNPRNRCSYKIGGKKMSSFH